MNYSTLAKIRDEAGFTGNTNVADTKITTYQDAATSHINGIIGKAYSLPLSETPKIVELIERKLAAGHLLLDQYGEEAEGTDRDGNAKVKWAADMLSQIEEGIIQLYDINNIVLTRSATISMKGWPNNTTKDSTEDTGAGGIVFTREKVF